MTKAKDAASNSPSPALLVLGFDDQQKPCGARFIDPKPALVVKAAQLMGLGLYKASSPAVLALAKKLPEGQLYANGRAFVPNIRQPLYSDLVVALAAEPQQAAVGLEEGSGPTPRGLPTNWAQIEPGHLVIAQECLEYGWWEALVVERREDMLTLRYRDYPRLPKFFRHRSAVALKSPPSE